MRPIKTTLSICAMALGLAMASAAHADDAAPTIPYVDSGRLLLTQGVSNIEGADAAGPGTCRIVGGAIPQNGWCQLYSKR